MKSIGQFIVQKEKSKTISEKQWDEKSIFYAFQRVIREEYGAQGVKNLVPDYFDRRTVFVKTESGTWGAELQLNRSHILEKLNKELGGRQIKEIKVKKH